MWYRILVSPLVPPSRRSGGREGNGFVGLHLYGTGPHGRVRTKDCSPPPRTDSEDWSWSKQQMCTTPGFLYKEPGVLPVFVDGTLPPPRQNTCLLRFTVLGQGSTSHRRPAGVVDPSDRQEGSLVRSLYPPWTPRRNGGVPTVRAQRLPQTLLPRDFPSRHLSVPRAHTGSTVPGVTRGKNVYRSLVQLKNRISFRVLLFLSPHPLPHSELG